MLKRSRALLSINGQIRFADFLLARASKTIFCWFQTLLKNASKNAEKVIGADWWPFFQKRVFDILTQKLPKCRRKTAQEMPIRADLNWQAIFITETSNFFLKKLYKKQFFKSKKSLSAEKDALISFKPPLLSCVVKIQTKRHLERAFQALWRKRQMKKGGSLRVNILIQPNLRKITCATSSNEDRRNFL